MKGGDIRVFELLMPVSQLLPFQIKRPAGILPIQTINAVPAKGGTVIDVLERINPIDLRKYAFDDYDYLVHFGTQDLSSDLPTGEYYLEVSDGINTWYSEVIAIKDFDPVDLSSNSCAITKITYWDTCDVADIFYRTAFFNIPQYKNIIYLDIDIGKPEYEFTEEGEEDGEGNFSPDYKRLEKQYLLQGVYPEYFVDALTLLPLHKSKTGVIEVLTDRGYTGRVDRITVDPSWQGERGLWALTDIVFSTEFVVKTNCCGHLDKPIDACLRTDFEVVARLQEGSDDAINREYTSAVDGSKIPLQENDYVLVTFNANSLERLYRLVNNNYQLILPNMPQGTTVIDANQLAGGGNTSDIYFMYYPSNAYFDENFTFDMVESGGQYYVKGVCWRECAVEIWQTRSNGLSPIRTKIDTGEQYNTNTGIQFDIALQSTGVYVVFVGINCTLGQSNTEFFNPRGIGIDIIESTFVIGSDPVLGDPQAPQQVEPEDN